jgi:hypothetical protein
MVLINSTSSCSAIKYGLFVFFSLLVTVSNLVNIYSPQGPQLSSFAKSIFYIKLITLHKQLGGRMVTTLQYQT